MNNRNSAINEKIKKALLLLHEFFKKYPLDNLDKIPAHESTNELIACTDQCLKSLYECLEIYFNEISIAKEQELIVDRSAILAMIKLIEENAEEKETSFKKNLKLHLPLLFFQLSKIQKISKTLLVQPFNNEARNLMDKMFWKAVKLKETLKNITNKDYAGLQEKKALLPSSLNQKDQPPFFVAVAKGDVDTMDRIYEINPSCLKTAYLSDGKHYSALHIALMNLQVDCVEWLSDKPVSLDEYYLIAAPEYNIRYISLPSILAGAIDRKNIAIINIVIQEMAYSIEIMERIISAAPLPVAQYMYKEVIKRLLREGLEGKESLQEVLTCLKNFSACFVTLRLPTHHILDFCEKLLNQDVQKSYKLARIILNIYKENDIQPALYEGLLQCWEKKCEEYFHREVSHSNNPVLKKYIELLTDEAGKLRLAKFYQRNKMYEEACQTYKLITPSPSMPDKQLSDAMQEAIHQMVMMLSSGLPTEWDLIKRAKLFFNRLIFYYKRLPSADLNFDLARIRIQLAELPTDTFPNQVDSSKLIWRIDILKSFTNIFQNSIENRKSWHSSLKGSYAQEEIRQQIKLYQEKIQNDYKKNTPNLEKEQFIDILANYLVLHSTTYEENLAAAQFYESIDEDVRAYNAYRSILRWATCATTGCVLAMVKILIEDRHPNFNCVQGALKAIELLHDYRIDEKEKSLRLIRLKLAGYSISDDNQQSDYRDLQWREDYLKEFKEQSQKNELANAEIHNQLGLVLNRNRELKERLSAYPRATLFKKFNKHVKNQAHLQEKDASDAISNIVNHTMKFVKHNL